MNSKSLSLLEMTNDLSDVNEIADSENANVLEKKLRDPTLLREIVQEKIGSNLENQETEPNCCNKAANAQNNSEAKSTELTADEAIITEMVQGLCTSKQKATFVKIIARYIR